MRRTVAITGGLVVLLLLGLAQLLLPGIAARRLRDRLSAAGTGVSVQVEAFPALELLWHHADRIIVHMDSYRSQPARLGNLLAQAADVGSLAVSVRRLDTGLLTLRQATLVKQGSALTAQATVLESDLRQAIPLLSNVTPVATGGGQLVLRGTVSLFGQSVSAGALVTARGGAVVVAPNLPLGGLAALTVFANPHLYVSALSAEAVSGGFTVSAGASLR